MFDNCSTNLHLCVHTEIHSLFLQCGFVNQRSHSLLLFFLTQKSTASINTTIPWLSSICSLFTIFPQDPVLGTTRCNKLWLYIKREWWEGDLLIVTNWAWENVPSLLAIHCPCWLGMVDVFILRITSVTTLRNSNQIHRYSKRRKWEAWQL